MNAPDTSLALHPFFLAGFGDGPYRFLYCYDLGEAMNPNTAANFGNMTGWVRDAPKLKAGLGTCACCGMAISLICVISNAAGELYGVGSDCAEKTGNDGIQRNASRRQGRVPGSDQNRNPSPGGRRMTHQQYAILALREARAKNPKRPTFHSLQFSGTRDDAAQWLRDNRRALGLATVPNWPAPANPHKKTPDRRYMAAGAFFICTGQRRTRFVTIITTPF